MAGPEPPDPPDGRVRAGRTNPLSDPAFRAGLRPIPSGPVEPSRRQAASAIVGVRPGGGRVEVETSGSGGPTLVCFLHVRCDGCDEFWRGLRDDESPGLPPEVGAVAVTKGSGSVEPAEVARAARGITRVPVVMSDQAWEDYRVTGYPFFVLVDAAGSVIGETVGFGWDDVRSMISASTT